MESENPLLKLVYKNEHNLLEQVIAAVSAGASPNECTEYFETPLRVASRLGRFDVVKFLFEVGADPAHLKWTPLFHAIAYGTIEEVKDCLALSSDITKRDTWGRTPFLVAIQAGDIEKAEYLLESGSNLNDTGRGDKSALEFAIQMDNAGMLAWLIQRGLNFEAYNTYGNTPLIEAVEQGAIRCVECLLANGADIYKKDRAQFSQKSTIGHASTLEIANILLLRGADINDLDDSIRSQLLLLGKKQEIEVTHQEYCAQKHREFGVSNPQLCDKAFWYEMVRCNKAAWCARRVFDDTDNSTDAAIWCYNRYGKSITPLGNGEFIVIGGEHEDSYDQDFCIYNEVFHHKNDGSFSIYQYPQDVFPPTDFHTATLVGSAIYIVGNLGYPGDRLLGTTPVFRLCLNDFSIARVEARGDNPGWIFKHSAKLHEHTKVRIEAGNILEMKGGEEIARINKFIYELDLEYFVWSRCDRLPEVESSSVLPEEYKRFEHSYQTLLSCKDENQWLLLKIIKVHRIDLVKGKEVCIGNEKITAQCDDFLYAVAYSTSEPFETLAELELGVQNKDWKLQNLCTVSRTTSFPKPYRYLGFTDVSDSETQESDLWRKMFDRGEAAIG